MACGNARSAFSSSYSTEAKHSHEIFAQRREASADTWTFGAFDTDQLVGVVTLRRFPNPKKRHNAGIYGMFVSRTHRQNGVGRLLVQRAINQARRLRGVQKLLLGVNEANQPAKKLYESLGVSGYAREENATLVDGKFHHELFMACPLLLNGGRPASRSYPPPFLRVHLFAPLKRGYPIRRPNWPSGRSRPPRSRA